MAPYKIIAILFLMSAFCSCQKVIHLNLGSATSQYVIVGNITDQPGPYTISITKSVNFEQDNVFPSVSGAKVYITDSTANFTDTLTEITPGNYQTHMLAGVPGHTYRLSVLSNDKIYTSSSAMPQPIALDSVYTQPAPFGSNINVVPMYKDPPGIGNYYNLILTIGDSVSQSIYIHDDEVADGNEVQFTLRNDIKVKHGDPVTVELQCTDRGVFKYYQSLQQTIQQNSATPANPQSNIVGGCLGYFSAHTVRRRTVLAP
jgi:hypothetical protein